jgi:hypothetical protein
MFLTEVEIFLSDAKVRSIDAFQKWLASPKSSGDSNAYAFGANDTCSKFLCVLKNLHSFGNLSEQIRLHTDRAAPSLEPVTSASSVDNKSPNPSAFSRNPHRCPVCGVSTFEPCLPASVSLYRRVFQESFQHEDDLQVHNFTHENFTVRHYQYFVKEKLALLDCGAAGNCFFHSVLFLNELNAYQFPDMRLHQITTVLRVFHNRKHPEAHHLKIQFSFGLH